jgi:hypothetical protein
LFVVEVCVYTHIYIYQKIQVCTIDILVPYIYSEKENVQKFNITCSSGWGACGGPCDGFHQWYHGLRRAAQRITVGMGKLYDQLWLRCRSVWMAIRGLSCMCRFFGLPNFH